MRRVYRQFIHSTEKARAQMRVCSRPSGHLLLIIVRRDDDERGVRGGRGRREDVEGDPSLALSRLLLLYCVCRRVILSEDIYR